MSSRRARIPGYGYLTIRHFTTTVADEVTLALHLDEPHCRVYNPGESAYYGIFKDCEIAVELSDLEDVLPMEPEIGSDTSTEYDVLRREDASREAEEKHVPELLLPAALRAAFLTLHECLPHLLGCYYLWAGRDLVVIEVKWSEPISDASAVLYSFAESMRTVMGEASVSASEEVPHDHDLIQLPILNTPSGSLVIEDRVRRVLLIVEEVIDRAGMSVFTTEELAAVRALISLTDQTDLKNAGRYVSHFSEILWENVGKDIEAADILLTITRNASEIRTRVISDDLRHELLRSATLRAAIEAAGFLVQERRRKSHVGGDKLPSFQGKITDAHTLLQEAISLLDW